MSRKGRGVDPTRRPSAVGSGGAPPGARGRSSPRPDRVALPEPIRDLLIGLALAAATCAVYAPVRGYGFVMYDDLSYVPETPQVARGLTWQGILWAFRSGQLANWHPLTWISHMLDVQCFGLAAGAHHVTSLLFHIANTLLLFLVLKKMTRAVWPSAFVAALFGLHPLHVESVAWIAERKDVLSAFFFLLALGSYARYAQRPGAVRYLASLCLFALGLMAKPMLVTLPFVLLLLDVWPLRRRLPPERQVRAARIHGAPRAAGEGRAAAWEPRDDGRLLLEKVPFFFLSAGSCIVTFMVQRSAGAVVAMDSYPLPARIANAAMSYVRYVGKTLWPSGLAAFYPYPAAQPPALVAGAVLLLAAITFAALRAGARRPYLAVGWLWYLGTLVPVIGIVQVGMQSMADRYTYLPLIGLFIAAAWGAVDLVGSPASPGAVGAESTRATRPSGLAGDGQITEGVSEGHAAERAGSRRGRGLVLPALAALALCALMLAARRQVTVWRDTESLFGHALEVTSGNAVAHNILGLALVREGRLADGIAHFEEALRIKPSHSTHFNLGLALAMNHRFDEAIANYEQALQGDPDNPKAHSYLGDALYHQGRLSAAASQYAQSLRLKPDQPEVRTNLGACLADQGRTDEAIVQYTEALRLRPDSADALNNLAVALAAQGRTAEAIARYSEAVRVKPDYADAHMNLANLLSRQGRDGEAAAHYQAVLSIRPADPSAREGLRRSRLRGGRGPGGPGGAAAK